MIRESGGRLVAIAFAHHRCNATNPHHGTAWVGLVAVAPDWRGRGAGRSVTARSVTGAVALLGATRVQAFARAGNTASCRMIEGCGLRLDPDHVSGIAQPAGAATFTR